MFLTVTDTAENIISYTFMQKCRKEVWLCVTSELARQIPMSRYIYTHKILISCIAQRKSHEIAQLSIKKKMLKWTTV